MTNGDGILSEAHNHHHWHTHNYLRALAHDNTTAHTHTKKETPVSPSRPATNCAPLELSNAHSFEYTRGPICVLLQGACARNLFVFVFILLVFISSYAHKRGVYVGDARGARVCATLCGTGDKRGVNSFAPIAHLRQLCVCHRARVSSALAKLYGLHICVRCVKTPTSMFCNVVHRHMHTYTRATW